MGRRRSGSSYRPEKRKDRDWDGDGLNKERRRREYYDDQFRPENIYGLFWKYQTEWHPKQDERFLDRKEFTDLVHELQTTKITTVHDEGMRRLKEAGKTRERVSTDSYKPSGSRTMSIASLASQSSSRTPTPQPRARCLSASLTATHEPSQFSEPPSQSRLSRAPSNPPPPPKVTTCTMIVPQPALTKTEHKPQPSDILAMTPWPTSTSPAPLHTPLPTASPSPTAIIEQGPQQSPSLRKSRFAPLESPKPRSQTQSETPPLPPQQQHQQRLLPAYIPPTPAELAGAISTINAACAAEDAKARARHVRQVKAGRALVWIEATKLAGDIPCLAELIAGASAAVGTEKKGPEGMTESAMVSAFAGLRRWGEEAEKSRTSLREAVGRLEGMGMVGVEVGEALGRVGELMGKVGTARWTLRDCLMIMRRGAVLVGERAELGGRKEGGGMVEEG